LGGIFDPDVPEYKSTKDLQRAQTWAQTNPNNIMLLGTALLVKVQLIRKIGSFDPAFFAYWEDTDFSVRSIQAGFRNVVDFNSFVRHKEKPSGSKAHEMKPHYWYYMARNETFFWKKHVALKNRLKTLWWSYEMQLGNLEQLRGSDVSRQAVLAGLWDGWISRTGGYRPDLRMPRLLANAVQLHSSRRAVKPAGRSPGNSAPSVDHTR